MDFWKKLHDWPRMYLTTNSTFSAHKVAEPEYLQPESYYFIIITIFNIYIYIYLF